MKVLLTGAGGFIGQALTAELAAKGHQVCAVALPAERDTLARRIPAAQWISWDLGSAPAPAELPARIDAVAHLAQSPHYREFPEKATEVFRVNCDATLCLLDYARRAGAGRFLLASSGSIYRRSGEPLTESSPVEPGDFYSVSKLVAEQISACYRGSFGVSVARLFCVYGPGQRGRMIPGLIERVRSGRPVTLRGENGMSINPLYLSDAVETLAALLGLSGSHVLNVAGEEACSIRRMAQLIGEALGRPPVFESGGPEEGDLVGSIDALRRLTGFRQRVAFAEGLRRTIGATGG